MNKRLVYYVKINSPVNQYELELGKSQQLQPWTAVSFFLGLVKTV